jgi:hypothetical protein
MTRRTKITLLVISIVIAALLAYAIYDYYKTQQLMWHTPLF